MSDIEDHEVFRFRKSPSEVVIAAVRPWRKHTYLNLRACYEARDGSIYPTTKGLTLPVEQLPDLVRAVHAFESALTDVQPEPVGAA